MRIARIASLGEGLVEVWSVHETAPGGRAVYHVDVRSLDRVERHTTRRAALDAAADAFEKIGGAV